MTLVTLSKCCLDPSHPDIRIKIKELNPDKNLTGTTFLPTEVYIRHVEKRSLRKNGPKFLQSLKHDLGKKVGKAKQLPNFERGLCILVAGLMAKAF